MLKETFLDGVLIMNGRTLLLTAVLVFLLKQQIYINSANCTRFLLTKHTENW